MTSGQADALAERYWPYQAPGRSLGGVIECEVFRLPGPLAPDPASLTWNGQYAMSLRRIAGGLDFTGVNFEARVQWGAPSNALLGVHEEAELAYPNVIENFMRVVSAHQALRAGGLLLHSAGVVMDGRAHVFAGYSGVGKTTMTRKAREAGFAILSDDINLILPDSQGGFRAYPVPFAGEFGLSLDALDPAGYPVAGIHALKQGETLACAPLTSSASAARLTAAAPFVNSDGDSVGELLAVASSIGTGVRVDELRVRRDTPFDAVRDLIGEQSSA